MSIHSGGRLRRAIKPTFVLVVIAALASGCNLPGQAPFTLPTSTLLPASATPTTAATATATEPPVSTPSATPPPTETSTPAPLSPVVINHTLCYNGPGKVWGVVTSLQADTNVSLIGKGSLPGWWIILNPTYNQPCWIADADIKIDPAYDATALQVYDVPPVPANLVPGKPSLDPSPPNCMDQFVLSLNVTNNGTQATVSGGTVSAVDTRSSNGNKVASASGTFPALNAGDSYKVKIKMTVSKFWGEKHQIIITVDPNNQIPESNDRDNGTSISYTLAQGSCP